MVLKRHLVGQIKIPDGLVDITDPCYDRDVWCRMNDVKVMPGTYNCYAYLGTDKDWGKRCWIAQIVVDDSSSYYSSIAEERIQSGRSWRTIGEIGVDAGLAGFFNHKPDFDDNEWDAVWMQKPCKECEEAYIQEFSRNEQTQTGGDGFWTRSGCGDGCYSVHAIRENRKIIALEIRF